MRRVVTQSRAPASGGWRSALFCIPALASPASVAELGSVRRHSRISMNDHDISSQPTILDAISTDTIALGFKMASEPQTGSLLRTLAASKPHGRFLELGTGTGFGTASILAGMDTHSRLKSVDSDAAVLAVAQRHLTSDLRVTFYHQDGAAFIGNLQGELFDFIYADTWPGKFTHLSETLALLAPGGLYLIDDLLPQPNWPQDHAPKIPILISELEKRTDLTLTKLSWATGLIVATKIDHDA